MKKKYTFLIIIGLIIFPFILILVIIFLFEYLTKNSPEYLAIITLDLSERIILVEFTALYPALLGIFATASLAYLIYRLEKNHERVIEMEEEIRVKRILSVLLRNSASISANRFIINVKQA